MTSAHTAERPNVTSPRKNDAPAGPGVKAMYNGVCPLCPTYIRKDRSWVAPLEVELLPNCVVYDEWRNEYRYQRTGQAAWMGVRYMVHERCWKKWNREYPDLAAQQEAAKAHNDAVLKRRR